MTRFLVLSGFVLFLSSAAALAQFEDDGSQWNGMHVCKQGANYFPMIGVDVHNNRFLCGTTALGDGVPDSKQNQQGQFFYNGKDHSVHVCSPGNAMVGLEAANNTFACKPAKLSGQPQADTGNQVKEPLHDRSTMHGCPSGVMVGLQVGDNVLICQ